MKKSIVIVTNYMDSHTDNLVQTLNSLGGNPIRLNTNDIPLNTSISISHNTTNWIGKIEIKSSNRHIDLLDVRSIWWRRPDKFVFSPDLSQEERDFATGEIGHAMGGIWGTIDCYWVSHPEHIRLASFKLEQLRRAAKMGFDIPRTLVTNNPEEARNFYFACDRKIIYKTLFSSSLGTTVNTKLHADQTEVNLKAVYTTFVTEANLHFLDTITEVTCQFQEYIPKAYELRVTVIGNEIFAAEIHSQADKQTSTDWRHYNVAIPYRKANLPTEIAQRCIAFVKSYQLNFSAIDLIVTPDGRYVFIENNPNGQFIFIEQRVPELKMTAALAAQLMRGSN